MVQVVQEVPKAGRVRRQPRHNFQLRHKPFQLQPFLLAPVLPGETMKDLLIQSRAVTKPLTSPIIGWWLEYYIFYVKHRDLVGRDDFTAMMLDLDKDMSAYRTAADGLYYHAANSFNWAQMCHQVVVETFFRADDEAWNNRTINNMPVCRINSDNITNSLLLGSQVITPADEALVVGADDTVYSSEIEAMMRTYEFQKANKLTDMTYEDFLATYGVKQKYEEAHKPELLRYIREWQYPSNAVEPTTGVPASAVSWAVGERADKDRYFREPGFIFGVTVARPKVYLQNQPGSMADWLMNALDWLPAIMSDDPWTSVRKYNGSAGPFPAITDASGYVLDLKDLFIHGDQFLNFDPVAATGDNSVVLPTPTANVNYPSLADADALFTGATSADKYIQQDGVVQIGILGRQQDTTPNYRKG